MSRTDLKELISGLTQDISFTYNGKHGGICPFSRDDIQLFYGDIDITVHSVDEAMGVPFINGKSLNEISAELNI